jgi:lycopene cyclase domain-containing protein
MNYFYLLVDAGLLLLPILFSFDKKLAFYRKWPSLFGAIIISGLFFLFWDQWFAEMDVWGFNAKYILGYYILDIPIEELFFFIVFPYAAVFIYESIRSRLRQNETFEELYRWFSLLFFGISCTLLYWFNDKLYTAVTCLVMTFILGTHLMVIRRRYMSWFYFAYVVFLAPMLLVNALLCAMPVIYYNPVENIDVTLFGIPVENLLYQMAFLAMCIGLYEWFNRIGLRYRLRKEKHLAQQ